MKRRGIIGWTCGILAVLTFVAAPLAMAAEVGGGWKDRPIGRLIAHLVGRRQALAEKLNLSDAQKEQIAAVLKQHKTELVLATKSMVEKKRAVAGVIRDTSGNEQAIRTAVDDAAKSAGDMCVLLAKVYREIDPIFTAEQRKAIAAFQDDRATAVDSWLLEIGQ